MTHHWATRTGRISVLISAVFLMLVLTAVPAAAETGTAATYSDTVLGFELPPGGGTGANCSSPQVAPFLGGSAGDLPGFWFALVPHTILSTTAMVCAGGEFGLWTQLNGQPTMVSGVFLGGAVTQTFSSCPGIQTYRVSALLAVAASVGGTVRQGLGSFQDVTLTHFVDASCNPFFAIVSGPVSLTF